MKKATSVFSPLNGMVSAWVPLDLLSLNTLYAGTKNGM